MSIRALAAAAGLSASRVHQIVAAADLDELDGVPVVLAEKPTDIPLTCGGSAGSWPRRLEFRAFCTRRRLPASSTPQLERAWDAWQAERY